MASQRGQGYLYLCPSDHKNILLDTQHPPISKPTTTSSCNTGSYMAVTVCDHD